MTHDASDAQHGAAEEWDDRCVGWRGLWSRLLPFCVLAVLFLYFLFYVSWIHRETLNLDETLKFALALPSALLVFGRPQIRSLFAIDGPQHITTRSEQNLADWIRKGAMASLLMILFHIALPEGDVKHAIGSLSASMFVALVISIGLGDIIVTLMDESDTRRQTDPLPLPPKAPTHGWIRDVLVWIAIAFVAIIVTAVLSVIVGLDNEGTRNLIWCTMAMSFYVLYYVVSVSYGGGTIGQRKAGSRVVRQTTGSHISFARAVFRALLLNVPMYCLLAYSSVASLHGESSDPSFFYQVVELSAIVSLLLLVSVGALGHTVLRDVHPRGQGVVDLCSGTMSVATPQAHPDERT